jgi:quercetin dioxygenase-like cupin family protein
MKRTASCLILFLLIVSAGQAEYDKALTIEPVLKTDTTSIGQKIVYPNFENDEVTIVKVTIPPGKSTGWHKHTFPVFAYVLKGTLTVEIEKQKNKKFEENSSFAEVIDVFHNGKNEGNTDLVLIAFYMGEKGKPLSSRKEDGTGVKK